MQFNLFAGSMLAFFLLITLARLYTSGQLHTITENLMSAKEAYDESKRSLKIYENRTTGNLILSVSRGKIDVLSVPDYSYEFVGNASKGHSFVVSGRDDEGQWIQIWYAGRNKWVHFPMLSPSMMESIPVVDPASAMMTGDTPEESYMNEVTSIVIGDGGGHDLISACNRVFEVFYQMSHPHNSPFSNDWKMELLVIFTTMNLAYVELNNLVPPNNLVRFHEILLEGASSCNQAAKRFREGLRTNNSREFETGQTPFLKCGQKIKEIRPIIASG